MKTKLSKTTFNSPHAKYTSKGLKLRWDKLEPSTRKYVKSQIGTDMKIIMEKGKKYLLVQRCTL